MTDITTRDEDKARDREIAQEQGKRKEQDEQRERELAMEKGKKKEQDEQHERELAQEKARKKGQEEQREHDRSKRKGGIGTGLTIVIGLIVIVLVVALAAFLSMSVSVTNVEPGNALPYTTMYSVSFPEGQTITVGNSQISVLSYQGELITDIDGDRQKLLNGQNRVIGERRAVVSTLGGVKLVDTNFMINLTYKGNRDNQAYFDMAIRTSKQIPDFLLQKLIPREIDARPM
jgi:hypothetical protein